MPQLPEVETLRRDLEREIVGRRIKEVEVRPRTDAMKIVRYHPRRKDLTDLLEGAKVERAGRRGMNLLLDLDNGRVLVVNPGPRGQLVKSGTSEEMPAHTHIVISFTIGGQLRIADPAKEAAVFVVARDELEEVPELKGYRMDPLEGPIAWQELSALLSAQEKPLKDALRDTSFICGLGDVYTDEILFVAGLSPRRLASKLNSQDVRRLYRALVEVIQDAVKARGTTSTNDPFRDLAGNPGQYQLELKVYERDGEMCRRCRATVVHEDGSYFCPQCQS